MSTPNRFSTPGADRFWCLIIALVGIGVAQFIDKAAGLAMVAAAYGALFAMINHKHEGDKDAGN